MKTQRKQLVLCRREDWAGCLSANLTRTGDRLILNNSEDTSGFICLRAIDSGSAGFVWGRVSVACRLPEDSMLRVYALAADSRFAGDWPDLDKGLAALSGTPAEVRARLAGIFGEPVSASEDFYVEKTGRYLWLMLELLSTGRVPPEISGVTVGIEGDHMADYLPALYQNDAFTRRFLSVFDSLLMDMEQNIAGLPARLDYRNTDDDMLRYLAGWMCVEGEGAPREKLVEWIGSALEDYETMYTVEGIRRSVRRLTGREPILIENGAVSPNRPDCQDPELYRRLYGDDPYKFFILLEEDTFPSRNRMEDFLERMKGLIPAGTELELVLLKKCVQLDWHTYLGVNSIVSSYVPVTIDENTTIHYDTMIGGK